MRKRINSTDWLTHRFITPHTKKEEARLAHLSPRFVVFFYLSFCRGFNYSVVVNQAHTEPVMGSHGTYAGTSIVDIQHLHIRPILRCRPVSAYRTNILDLIVETGIAVYIDSAVASGR